MRRSSLHDDVLVSQPVMITSSSRDPTGWDTCTGRLPQQREKNKAHETTVYSQLPDRVAQLPAVQIFLGQPTGVFARTEYTHLERAGPLRSAVAEARGIFTFHSRSRRPHTPHAATTSTTAQEDHTCEVCSPSQRKPRVKRPSPIVSGIVSWSTMTPSIQLPEHRPFVWRAGPHHRHSRCRKNSATNGRTETNL